MSEPQGEIKPQLLLCGTPARYEFASRAYKLRAIYVNGEWPELEGARVVCLDQELAPIAAVSGTIETKWIDPPLPSEGSDEQLKEWIKKHAKVYAASDYGGRNPATTDSQESPAAGHSPTAAPNSAPTETPAPALPSPAGITPRQGAEPDSSQDEPPPCFPEDEAPPTEWLGVEAESFGAPADLWGNDSALPTIPPECLPDALAPYILDEAAVMGCDPGMLGLYCIGVCAGATTDEIRVQVKSASDRWLESPRLWCMIVGDSGLTMKSPSLDAAMSHAWAIERSMRLNGSEAIKNHALDVQIYEAQKAEYVKARAKGDAATPPKEPDLPIAERLIIGNATMEAIADVLLQQGEKGALVRADELLGFISGAAGGQYKAGKGSDRQDALELHNGGPHPIDRKGRTVLIRNWGVSIVGGTQPEQIARVAPQLETDGLLQRFTVYLPHYYGDGENRQPDKAALQRYREVLDRLVKLAPQPMGQPVQFSPEAARIIEDARGWISETVRGSWLPSALRSHLSKWPALLARFCITYAAIEAADEHQPAIQPVISDHIAAQVWQMMHDCLWPHAKHFYLTTLSGAGDRAALRQLAGLILAEGWDEITTRTMTQRSSIYAAAKMPERRSMVGAMVELGWLNPIGGKSSIDGLPTKYRVNGDVHRRFAHIAAQERVQREEKTLRWREAKAAKAALP